jgi:uncharacterized membrane protein
MSKTLAHLLISSFIFTLSLLILPSVFAQSVDNLTLSTSPTTDIEPVSLSLTAIPPRLGDDFSLVAAPGQILETTIEVRNPSDLPITVETYARDFIIGTDGSTPIPVDTEEANPRWQLSQWLTLTPTSSVIKPRGSTSILVNIAIPQDALAGGRYAMILHQPVTGNQDTQNTGAQITAQVGTLLYVVVEGDIVQDARISNFTTSKTQEKGPVDFNFSVINNSSVHIRPDLQLKITNLFGQKITEFPLEQKNIFPENTRQYDAQWEKDWGFGYYTATITGNYGAELNGTVGQLNATTSFWLIPLKLIGAIVLIIILLIIIIAKTRKKHTHTLTDEAQKTAILDEKFAQAHQEKSEQSDQPPPTSPNDQTAGALPKSHA